MTRWGWEFLRRRDDYRRAWQERVRPFVNGDHYDLAAVNRHNLDVLRACKEGRPLYLPPPWDALRDDFKVYGDPATRTPHNSKLDPRLAQPPWFQGLGVTTVVFSTRGHTPDSKVLIEYDLNLPIKPQLKNAAVALLLKAEACGVADPDGGMQVDKFPISAAARLQGSPHVGQGDWQISVFQRIRREAARLNSQRLGICQPVAGKLLAHRVA
jgi:hypothetical protein